MQEVTGCNAHRPVFVHYGLHIAVFSLFIPFSFAIVLYCGMVPAANAPGCTPVEGLLYRPWSLVVPTCTARCLHQRP